MFSNDMWLNRLLKTAGQFAGPLALLGLLGVLQPQTAAALGNAPGNICARIVGFVGDVEVNTVRFSETGRSLERAWTNAKDIPNQELLLHDRIRTRKGRIRIEFADEMTVDGRTSGPSVFNIGEYSEIALTEFNVDIVRPKERNSVIDLIRGAIRNFMGHGSYTVRAASVACAIRGGAATNFTMTHDPEEGYVNVSVAEGQVNLSSPEDARVVKAGQSAAMVHGKFLEQPLP